jgi:magnesium-transporting ATPase (P-type)
MEVISFTSKRKKASVVHHNKDKVNTDEEIRVYCKGAPDMLFPAITKIIGPDGNE